MKRIVIIAFIICMLGQFKLIAESTDVFNNLIEYLNNEYNNAQNKPLNVLKYHHNKLLIEKDDSIQRGSELLIYPKTNDVPYYLTEPINAAIIRDELNDGFIAESIKEIDKNKGPLIASKPLRPIIYIPYDEGSNYYELLVNTLNKNGFIVKEMDNIETSKPIENYGIILFIDSSKHQPQLTIKSLYFDNILYKENLSPQTMLEEKSQTKPLTNNQIITNSHENIITNQKKYKLPQEYYRLRIANIDGVSGEEFILLDKNNISIFKLKNNNLQIIATDNFTNKHIVPIHLHTIDINNDKKEEIILTMGEEVDDFGFTDTKISSKILSFKDNSLIPIEENIPYYLRVIEDEKGKKILLGQKKGKYTQYEGNVVYFLWDSAKSKLVNKGIYKPAKNIYSIYQFNLLKDNPGKVAILEPNNYIRLYDSKTSKSITTLETSCGDFKITPIKIKLRDIKYLGGFDRKITYQEFYTPRRFELISNGQIFTIKKSKTNLSFDFTELSLKGESIDKIIAIKYENGYLAIPWQSMDINSDILDFAIGDSENEQTIYVLARNLDGYWIMSLQ